MQIVDAAGIVQTPDYDPLNRLARIDDPAGGVTTSAYDGNGNLTRQTDALNRTWQYVYDAVNRQTQTIDPLLNAREFTYDAQNDPNTFRDAVGNTTSFDHDLLNRAVQRTDATGAIETFAYDSRSNLTRHTDRKGQLAIYAYDDLSRLTRIETPDNVLTYSYDERGNLLAAGDGDSGLAFTYDFVERLDTARTLPGFVQPDVTLTNLYDAVDRAELKNTAIPPRDPDTPSQIDYGHDRLSRVTGVTLPGDVTMELAYDPNGLLRRVGTVDDLGPLSYVTHDYDSNGRLAQLALHQGATDEIARSRYGRDASGRITSIDEGPGRLRSFAYDQLYQLTASGTAAEPESYSYDPQGNRTASHLSSLYLTGAGNRLLEDQQFTYGYDANGNLATKTEKLSGLTTTYSWDAQDQLVRIDFPDGSFAAYRYDALGRRIEKDLDGTISRYVHDGDTIAHVFDGANRLTASFVHGEGVDQPLIARIAYDDPDAPGGIGLENFIYHADHQGSIRYITDTGGTVMNAYSYDAYGRTTALQETIPNPYGFTGREFDAESGLYYYRSRYYDPETGRFLSPDPIGFAGSGFNLYRYVLNDPATYRDPSGLTPAGETGLTQQGTRNSPKFASIGQSVRCMIDMTTSAAVEYVLEAQIGIPVDLPNLLCRVKAQKAKITKTKSKKTKTKSKKTEPDPPVCSTRPGRRGGKAHRDTVDAVFDVLAELKLTDLRKESHVPTPGGHLENRFADVSGVDKSGERHFFQIGKQTQCGAPVARERRAADDILNAPEGGSVWFIPYN